MTAEQSWREALAEAPGIAAMAAPGGAIHRLATRRAELQRGWGKHKAANALTEALRSYLAEEIDYQKPPFKVAEILRRWASEARIENLAEWLELGGWDRIAPEELNTLNQAVSRAYSSARRELAAAYLSEKVAQGGPIADRMSDLVWGTRLVDRLSRLGPPTFAGMAPGADALRFMLAGWLWSGMAVSLSRTEGERWLLTLAGVWVRERQAEEMERIPKDYRVASLVVPMVRGLVDGHSGRLALLDADGKSRYPSTDEDTARGFIEQAHTEKYAVLRKPDAWMGLSLEILLSHEQKLAGKPDPHILNFNGGYRAMAKAAGATTQDTITKLVRLQGGDLGWLRPDGRRGNLLTLTEPDPTCPGRSALLTLELGEYLCDNYVHLMERESGRAAQKRRLVPWVPPPKGVGRPEWWGAQMAFQYLVLAYIRNHAQDLKGGRGVELTTQILKKDADLAMLPARLISTVLEWWAGGGDRLARLSEGRYTLSDTWAYERTAIINGADQAKGKADAARQFHASRRRPKA